MYIFKDVIAKSRNVSISI